MPSPSSPLSIPQSLFTDHTVDEYKVSATVFFFFGMAVIILRDFVK